VTRRNLIACAFIAALAAAGCGEGSSGGRQFRSIGTAGTGGIYYPLGGTIASRLSVLDSTSQYTAEVTGGSVENIARLNARQMDLAIALSVTMYEAYRGIGDYDEPIPGLRVVAPLYPNITHVMVPEGSTVTDISQLRGGRVSVGSAGSGTEQSSRQLLLAHGISYDDINVQYLTFTESANALRDGAIDGSIISVGYPAAAVLEATTTGGARLIALSDEAIETMIATYPYYSRGELPGGIYPGADEPVQTIAMMNWIISMDHLEAPVVNHVLGILQNEREILIRVSRMVEQVDFASLDVAPIPIHAATEQWLADRD
jgi:TRAP transporter TAXI family solute receptor